MGQVASGQTSDRKKCNTKIGAGELASEIHLCYKLFKPTVKTEGLKSFALFHIHIANVQSFSEGG